MIAALAVIGAGIVGYLAGSRARPARAPEPARVHALGELLPRPVQRCRCGHGQGEHYLRSTPGGRGCKLCPCVLFAPRR